MRVFENAVVSGDLSPDSAYLAAYGIYLSNGGTPEGFQSLTMDEVQLIYTMHEADRIRENKMRMEGIAKVIGMMFGGE